MLTTAISGITQESVVSKVASLVVAMTIAVMLPLLALVSFVGQ